MLPRFDCPNEGRLRHNHVAQENEASDAKGVCAPGAVAVQILCGRVVSGGNAVGAPNESDEDRNA